MKTASTAATVFFAGLVPLTATAQDVIVLDEITASANLEDIARARSGSSVTVLTADQIRASGETRVTDILARLPGVDVTTTGPMGTRTGITLRGASQNYVSVLVDGIEVTDPSITQVAFDFGTLAATDIGRIEVLKGSQSALYGSEAIGGVIDITTRRASKPGTEHSATLEYGSHDTRKASYGLAAMGKNHELAFTLSHLATDGFSAADENAGNTEADGYRANRLSFYGHHDLEGGARIGVSGFAETNSGDFDESGGAGGDGAPPYDEYNDNRSHGLRGFAEFSAGGIDHAVNLTWFDAHRVSTYEGFPAIYDGTRAKIAYQGGTDIGVASRLVFGADWTRETAQDNFGFSGDNTVAGLIGEFRWSPSADFDLTASLRHDEHSQFGGYTTGRLAAAYRPRSDLTIRGSLGTGFRAPSLYELYSGYGDPSLTPETSLSADLGVEKSFGAAGYLRLTVFTLEVDDLIDFDFTAAGCSMGPGCYGQVPGLSRRTGLELEGGFALGDSVRIDASYTYTDSATSASSSWGAVPRHDFGLSATADLTPAVAATLSAQFAADRQNGLPDYGVANATLTRDFGDGAEGYLRVENLFDAEYQTVKGYGTTDRAFHVGLRKSF